MYLLFIWGGTYRFGWGNPFLGPFEGVGPEIETFLGPEMATSSQSIPLGPLGIFSKIRGDIRKSRCTTGINDTGGKFATGVNDIGGSTTLEKLVAKFATGGVDTGGKFVAGVNDAGGNLPPV